MIAFQAVCVNGDPRTVPVLLGRGDTGLVIASQRRREYLVGEEWLAAYGGVLVLFPTVGSDGLVGRAERESAVATDDNVVRLVVNDA